MLLFLFYFFISLQVIFFITSFIKQINYNIDTLNNRNTYKLYHKYQSKLIKNLKKMDRHEYL